MKRPHWHHQNVLSKEQLDVMIDAIWKRKAIGFDIETDGLEWYGKSRPIGLGFGYLEEDRIFTFYIPIGHETGNINIPEREVYNEIKQILESTTIQKIGANIKFDTHFMIQQGIAMDGVQDIQVMARLLRSDYMQVSLDVLMEKDLHMQHLEWNVLKTWLKQNKLSQKKDPSVMRMVPVDYMGAYCGKDVYGTLALAIQYLKELKAEPRSWHLYQSVERPLLNAVVRMEEAGIKIDVVYLERIKKSLEEKARQLEAKIYRLAKREFDIRSSKQLMEILPKFGVKPENRRRKKGDETTMTPSLDKSVLEKYEKKVPLVATILAYKTATGLLSNFVDNMILRAKSGEGNFIHASVKQDTARTGRLGCAEPNLMNLPREDEADAIRKLHSIRRAVVPFGPKSVLISIDYSQIEYRLLAHFSRDPVLCEGFAKDKDFDIHTYVAKQLFGDEITKEQRYIGKKFNFAQLYGAGEEKLAVSCSTTIQRVRELNQLYMRRFPTVIAFKRRVEATCLKQGGIWNPFGRFRRIPRQRSYIAVNTLIQGTAADILKIAMVRIDKFLIGKQSKLLLPIHDELIFDFRFEDGCIFPDIIRLMTTFNKDGKPVFRVPMAVEVSECAKNWSEKKELDIGTILQAEIDGRERLENGIKSGGMRRVWGHPSRHGGRKVGTVSVCSKSHSAEGASCGWN